MSFYVSTEGLASDFCSLLAAATAPTAAAAAAAAAPAATATTAEHDGFEAGDQLGLGGA